MSTTNKSIVTENIDIILKKEKKKNTLRRSKFERIVLNALTHVQREIHQTHLFDGEMTFRGKTTYKLIVSLLRNIPHIANIEPVIKPNMVMIVEFYHRLHLYEPEIGFIIDGLSSIQNELRLTVRLKTFKYCCC